MRWAALALLLLTLGRPVSEAECIVIVNPDPLLRLRYSKYVYLAQVAEVSKDTAQVKVLRSWRGKKRAYRWRRACGVRVGEYYLVYGQSDPEVFNCECGIVPMPLDKAHRDITMLDRQRGFPPLVVPTRQPDE